jgi:uncharacterized phiE125 gp8 family phage protein
MADTRVLIAAPTDAVISVADIKRALGISSSEQDQMIEAARDAVVASLDPGLGGFLGRALRPQTWELRLPDFYSCRDGWSRWGNGAIELPYPPLSSITSIKYDDGAGAEQTLAEGSQFRVLGLGAVGKQAVAPLYGASWPATRNDVESVRIRYVAGYPAGASDQMPKPIRQAVALGVRMFLSNVERNLYLSGEVVPGTFERRYVVSDAASKMVTLAMQELLSTYRIFG